MPRGAGKRNRPGPQPSRQARARSRISVCQKWPRWFSTRVSPPVAATLSTPVERWTWTRNGSRQRALQRLLISHPGADPGIVPRQDQAQSPAGLVRRHADERLHVRVAADHAVERDQVGLRQIGRKRHGIALVVGHPAGQPTPVGLCPGGLEIGARGVHVDRRCRSGRQQRVVHGADTGPDVQHRQPVDAACRQPGDQPGRPSVRPALPVLEQTLAGAARVELVVVDGRLAAVHVVDPRPPGSRWSRRGPSRHGGRSRDGWRSRDG